MSMEPVDYLAILADLEAKKAALEHTITSFRQAMAMGALGQMATESGGVPSVSVPSMTGGEVPAGAFHGKSIPEATQLYLEIVKRKQTGREIAEALQKGGMESTSKNFAEVVGNGLNRARRLGNSGLVKLGAHWGLASWYPKGIVTAATEPKKAKKKKKKNRKPAANEAKSKPKEHAHAKGPQPVPPVISTERNPAERVLEILRVNSGTAFTTQELAKMLKLEPSRIPLILGNLIRGHKVEKTKDGKYTAVTSMGAAV
jgi:hypothetical protein